MALKLHCKNTCVVHTQDCVLFNTLLVSYMNNTRLCYPHTIACVIPISTQVCVVKHLTCVNYDIILVLNLPHKLVL